MKEIKEMTTEELRLLKNEIERELVERTTCTWGLLLVSDKKKDQKEEESWEGEKFIS